jgi:uncharacterized protein YpmB
MSLWIWFFPPLIIAILTIIISFIVWRIYLYYKNSKKEVKKEDEE